MLLLKIIAGVMAVAAVACFAMPAVVKWTLRHSSRQITVHGEINGAHGSVGVIGGADGPTAIFITTKQGGFPINDSPPVVGGVLAAGAAGLWLWARRLSRKKQG